MSNPKISLTDLVDVILKSGLPKATKVKQIKRRPDYEPAFDFYKPLRDSIIDAHKSGHSKRQFQISASARAHPKKQGNYTSAIAGYSKWWGNKQFAWRTPARNTYSNNGIDVLINPELGVEWSGQKHVIKLYLKDEALTKNRADMILSLLEFALRTKVQQGTILGLLDVRSAKLFTSNSLNPITKSVIDAELAYMAAIWPSL